MFAYRKSFVNCFFYAVALLCSSCSVKPSGTGYVVPYVRSVGTKASPVTVTDLKAGGFCIDAWLENEGVDNRTGNTVPLHYIQAAIVSYDSRWTIEGSPRWLNGIETRFWCWNRAAADYGLNIDELDYQSTDDFRSFSFAVPATAANRKDIVTAYSKKTWSHSSGDEIGFSFFHPLAGICFCLSDDFSENIEIAEIGLKNVYRSGDFSFGSDGVGSEATFTWTNQSSRGDVILSEGVSKAEIGNIWFYVPEQNLSVESSLCVTFINKADGTRISREVSVYNVGNDSMNAWTSSRFYRYNLKATEDLLHSISFSISVVADWRDDGKQGSYEFQP